MGKRRMVPLVAAFALAIGLFPGVAPAFGVDLAAGEARTQDAENNAVFSNGEAHIELNGECDRTMLPDWDGWINATNSLHVENATYPDGRDFEYTVTKVESSDERVVEVTQDDGGGGWNYRAIAYGDATITVTYDLPEQLGGTQDSYEFAVVVASDVYETWIDTETGSGMALPGKSVNLSAGCKHDFNDDTENADEGFSFAWKLLDDGESFANLTVDPDDSSKATVTFRDLTNEEAEEGLWQNIRVEVVLHGNESADRASNGIELHMASSYTEIWPTRNNAQLIPGKTEPIAVELRSYPGTGGAEYDIVEDAEFRWEGVNADAVQILDENGKEVEYDTKLAGTDYTIKRLQNRWTDFRLVAEWGDEGYTDRWYRYEELDANIWLDCDTWRVFDDGTLDLSLNVNDALADCVTYTVGLWDGDANEGEGGWSATFEQGDGWSASADNRTVTLNGAALLAKDGIEDWTNVRVFAALELNGEVARDCDRWIEVRKAYADYDHDREWDRSMLPGWDGEVRTAYTVWVENSAHPEGAELEYKVTGVEIESQEPDEDAEAVLSLAQDGDAWRYTAEGHGRAVVKVAYAIPEELGGGSDSYTFEVYVGGDVYDMNIEVADGASDMAGPGGSIALVVDAVRYVEEDGDENGQKPLENCTYIWRLRDEARGFATLTNKGSQATLTFKDLDEGQDELFEEAWVEVRLYDENGDECAYADKCLRVETHKLNDCTCELVTEDEQGQSIYAAVNGSWAIKFLQGADATFAPEVVLRDGDEVVDPSMYAVRFERVWWDGDERKTEVLEGPLSVADQGSFNIVIEPVDGSAYRGAFERETAEIELVNEYSLRTSYVDMYFQKADGTAFDGIVDDRINGMNPNYHVVPVAIAADYLNALIVRTGGTFSIEENTHNGHLLERDTDYTVAYYRADPAKRVENPSPATMAIADPTPLAKMPTAPGTYVLAIRGAGLYADNSEGDSEGVLIDIQGSMEDAAVARVPDQAWTGTAITPALQVTYGDKVLAEGVDYEVEWSNNTDAGTATATITGCNPILRWGYHGHEVTMTPTGDDRFYTGSKDVTFEIVKPEYEEPSYTWSNDGKSVSATRTCTNSPDLTIVESGAVAPRVSKAATCTEKGETTYTATFSNDAFSTQTKTLADVDALGHSWGYPSYSWSSDCKTVTATRTCENNAAHVQTEKVTPASKVTTKATLTAKGKTTYTATFKNAAFKTQTKTLADIAKNNMTVKASAKTVKFSKLKKKAQTVAAITVKNAKGRMSYKRVGGNAKSKKALSVNKKTGMITVKKGTAKGTYAIKVKATSAASSLYATASKTVTVKVKVK